MAISDRPRTSRLMLSTQTQEAERCPVHTADWDRLPRLLSELCDMGHYREEVFRLDLPGGNHTWLCRTCYVPRYIELGRPPQHHRYCDTGTHRPGDAQDRPDENPHPPEVDRG